MNNVFSRFLSFFGTVAFAVTMVFAVGRVAAEQRELKSDATELVDAVLVLDTSGTMLINDPNRLRDEGARLFCQFLKQGDRLGVVEFAQEARTIRPLSPFEPTQLDDFSKQIQDIKTTGEYTDILAGLKLADDMLRQDARKEARPIIILLSDGKMEPDPRKGTAAAFTEQLLSTLLPEMKNIGERVYTLAFSEEADKELLSQIATTTDGVSWFTPDAEKIHQSYAELFLTVKKPQVIPLGGKAFPIDSDVQEATFYVNREDGQEVSIINPQGVKLTAQSSSPNIKWFSGQKFDVITISSPEVGNWQVLGISPQEGFATILTNLKLVTDFPVTVEAGSPQLLQARLYEAQKPVSLPEMTGAVRYAFQITPTDRVSEPVVRDLLVDNGTNGDKISKDGIFSYMVTLEEPGEYRLRVIAKAPTFERQQQIPFRVKPKLVSVRVVEGEAEVAEKAGEEKAEAGGHSSSAAPHGPALESKPAISSGSGESMILVVLSEEARTFKNIQVKLMAVDVQRNRYLLPVTRSLDSPFVWEISAGTLPKDGKYDLQATVVAEGKNRAERRDTSRVAVFTRTPSEGKASEEEQATLVVAKPKGPPFWKRYAIPQCLIITILNAIVGIGALKMLRKAQGQMATAVPDFAVPPKVLSGIDALEKKIALKEIDLADPMFNEEPAGAQPAAGAAAAKPAAT